MERSAIVGFIITVVVALFLASGYFIYKATQNPTPPSQRSTTIQPSKTTTPRQPQQAKPLPPRQTPPLKVEPPNFLPPQSDPEAVIKMTREVQGGGAVAPGRTLDITLFIEKEGSKPIRALGIQELLPDGWSFDSVVSGEKPNLIPPKGRTPLIEFAWFNIPEFPLQLTYRVKVADNFNAPAEIKGQTLYRADGGELRTDVIVSPVVPSSGPVATSTVQDSVDKSDERQPDGTPVTELKQNTAPLSSKPRISEPSDLKERMSLNREINPKKYTPGGKLEISINMTYTGSKKVTALGLVEQLPEGFKFERIVGGSIPEVIPKKGDSLLQFAWVNIPEFPAKLTYEVSIDSATSGDKIISGQLLFHTDGPQRQSNRVISKISQAQ